GPEPAPRDTCSCDAAGCDFGRVREEFDLDIATADDPRASAVLPLTPPRASVDRVVARAVGGGALASGLVAAGREACPEPSSDGWLALASFTATISTEWKLVDIGEIVGGLDLLAETALLQDLLLRELGAQLEAGALVDGGPEVKKLTLLG